jgi:diguanylate cyclase (GGDEF)-like protein/PAS domain S-box-containing protein
MSATDSTGILEGAGLYKTILDNLHDGAYFVDRDRRITFWNRAAERLTGYTASEVLGSSCSDNILIHVDVHGNNLCKGLCPVAETIADGELRSAEVFMHHKDGHRVPVNVRVAPIRDANCRIIGAVELFTDSSAKIATLELLQELQELALVDPVTGVANRRLLEDYVTGRLGELSRYTWPFGVLFIDVDRFKQINDTHGHEIGDRVLKMVADTLSGNARPFDLIGRWGGDEFVALIINVDREQLTAVAEKFRMLVEHSGVPGDDGPVSTTVSVGGTTADAGDTLDSLMMRADELMYQSKSVGGNCVSVA